MRHFVQALSANHKQVEACIQLKEQQPRLIRAVLHRTAHRPVLTRALLGNQFPATIHELPRHAPGFASDRTSAEINWSVAIAAEASESIDHFLAKRNAFERALLRGDYQLADEQLRQIYERLGYSLWFTESRMLLEDARSGPEGCRRELDVVRAQADKITLIFIDSLCHKIRSDESAATYDRNIDFMCGPLVQGDAEYRRVGMYLRFKLNRHRLIDSENLAFALFAGRRYSVIDQYCDLVRALQLTVALEHQVSDEITSARGAVEMLRGFSDPTFRVLSAILDSSRALVQDPASELLLEALGSYTRGDYVRAHGAGAEGIDKFPEHFAFYEIYSKSGIHQGLVPTQLSPGSTIRERISHSLHHFFLKDARSVEAASELRKLAYQLDGLQIGPQLFEAVRVPQRASEFNYHRLSAAVGSLCTPRLALGYESSHDALRYFRRLRELYGENPAIALFEEYYEQLSRRKYGPINADVPKVRQLKYQALTLESVKEYDKALSMYQDMRLASGDRGTPAADAIAGLYRCFLALKRSSEAVDLVSELLFSQPSLISSLDLGRLIEIHERSSNSYTPSALNWCIVLHLAQQFGQWPRDAGKVHESYERLLEEAKVDRPSAIAMPEDPEQRGRVAYFLKNTCVLSVMDYSISFGSTDELELERVKVCELLTGLDPSNRSEYTDEIAQLTQQAMIRRLIRHVDESKIFVDTKRILDGLDQSFRERFQRFVEAAAQSSERIRAVRSLLEEMKVGGTIVVNDPAYGTCMELFALLRDRFVASDEYGLDAYLSIRIRHGTLSGHIRSQFESAELITQTDADGKYRSNERWESLADDGDTQRRLGLRLAVFSQRIDQAIAYVKDSVIQIRHQREDPGWFNFDYTEQEARVVYGRLRSVKDLQAFAAIAFEELWRRTNDCLARVRAYIANDLWRQLADELSDLERDVNEIVPAARVGPLSTAIAQCRTAIQNELENIADWFRVAESESPPDYSVESLVTMGLELTSRRFPATHIDSELAIDTNLRCRGSSFAHLSDILMITLENIVHHSDSENIEARISASSDDDELIIEVANPLAPEASVEQVRERLTKIEDLIHSEANPALLRTEGGTGFYKLHKILSIGLERKYYRVDFSVSDERRFTVRVTMESDGVIV